MKGTEFVEKVKELRGAALSRAALDAMLAEELPDFLADPNNREDCFTEAVINGRYYRCEYQVLPNYLAIGEDDDYVLWPLSIIDLQAYCDATTMAWTGPGGGTTNEWFIPPKKIVFTTWAFSACKIVPQALGASGDMTWPETILKEQRLIDAAMKVNGCARTAFTRAKKAYITAPNMADTGGPTGNGVLHFTGWYSFSPVIPDERTVGTLNGRLVYAVQAGDEIGGPVGHESDYADYSHGCDLVRCDCYVNGERFTFDELCTHPVLNVLVSDQGAFNPRFPNADGRRPARTTSRMPKGAALPVNVKDIPEFVVQNGVSVVKGYGSKPALILPMSNVPSSPTVKRPSATGMSGSTKLAIALGVGIAGYAAWHFYKTRRG